MTIVVTMNADDEIAELLHDIVKKVAASTSSSSLMSRRNGDTASTSVARIEGVDSVPVPSASPVRRGRHDRVQSDPQQALFLTPPAEDEGHQSLNNSFEQEENQWLTDSWRQAKQSLIDARLHDLEVSRELERVCSIVYSVSPTMFFVCALQENTHLYLSEMLIAAVEQMKWRSVIAGAVLCKAAPHASSTSGIGQSLDEQGADDSYPASEYSLPSSTCDQESASSSSRFYVHPGASGERE